MCLTVYTIYQCGHCYQEYPLLCAGAKPKPGGWFSCFFPDPPPCYETEEHKYTNGYCPTCVGHSRLTTRAQAQLRRSRKKGRSRGSKRGSRRDRDRARRRLEDDTCRETHHRRVPLAVIMDPTGVDQVYHAELTMAAEPVLPKSSALMTATSPTPPTSPTLPTLPTNSPGIVSPLTQSEADAPTFAVLDYDEYSEYGSVERVSFGRSRY
ncbi:hypothetical protein B0J13DRAFT_518394 [Dactylonectria estremocensis]|uniref:Uncharacterized protein n=1 Tax=Dactylonectria estremocensis TaxID=1079267 RepID=A0A9P9FKJ6_9HYPO|nr:hypothetical protein B0J13DRAFT_518394 [Dactylonectria estremocensis]